MARWSFSKASSLVGHARLSKWRVRTFAQPLHRYYDSFKGTYDPQIRKKGRLPKSEESFFLVDYDLNPRADDRFGAGATSIFRAHGEKSAQTSSGPYRSLSNSNSTDPELTVDLENVRPPQDEALLRWLMRVLPS